MLANLLEQVQGLAPAMLRKADVDVDRLKRRVEQDLERLPRVYDVWQVGFRRIPKWLESKGQRVVPWVVLAGSRSSGLVLATSSGLFKLIDSWLVSLPAEYFAQVLPLLRRATSTFSTGERRQIAERVRNGASSVLFGGGDDLDTDRAALVEPIVLTILGIEP